MITMKKARRLCPKTETRRETVEIRYTTLNENGVAQAVNAIRMRTLEVTRAGDVIRAPYYKLLEEAKPLEPFRDWARRTFKKSDELSPKLARIVRG